MGQMGLELFDSEKDLSVENSPLSKNITPSIGEIMQDGYCQEEWKMINESRRILESPGLAIHPTTVMVPIKICHGESVYIETKKPINRAILENEFNNSLFLKYSSDIEMLMNATNTTKVCVGRLRIINEHSAQYWCIADNLLVGSAWNAFQIIESLKDICDG